MLLAICSLQLFSEELAPKKVLHMTCDMCACVRVCVSVSGCIMEKMILIIISQMIYLVYNNSSLLVNLIRLNH